jgi:hypothetical protein
MKETGWQKDEPHLKSDMGSAEEYQDDAFSDD